MSKEEFDAKDPIDLKEEVDLEDNEEVEATNIEEDGLNNKKDEEISDLNTKLMRLQADFINYKKRTEKEKENSINYGFELMACELLPIIDNFQRALAAVENKEDSFYKGISMIEEQLLNMLNKNSIKEMEALGSDFDPNLHHAVFMEESQEYDSGKVIDILQKGYMYKEKVIRPAMVKVAK